jgi:diguanylate cyclase (GGDEF)-like protein
MIDPDRHFRTRIVLFITMMIMIAVSTSYALDPAKRVTQYTLTTWQAKDGLPQETTTAITQDVDGAIWIGTPSGLIRFDGVRFRRHPLPAYAGPGDHYITGLLTDPDGSIWATTRSDLFRMHDGVFKHWGVADGLPAGGALGLVMMDDGSLALATEQGVAKFDPRTQTAHLLGVERGSRSSALTIARGQSGRIWAGAMRGLLQLNTVSTEVPISIGSSGHDIVNAVLEDSSGRLWIGTSLGIRIIEGGRERRYPALDAVTGLWIRCLIEDRDKNIWIGTRGNGAFRFLNGELHRFGAEEGLPDDLVRQIFEDRDGSLWFVTAGGLARLRDGAATPWTVREGLPEPFVWSVYGDPKGVLWVGTSGGGVVHLGEKIPGQPLIADPGLDGVEIRSFLTDQHGELWIGTGGNGLARVHNGALQWFRWAPPPGRDTVYSLLEDSLGRIWIGTGNGLGRLEGDRDVTWFSRTDTDQPTVVRSIGEDASGRIWVGTTAGLLRINDGRLVPVPGAEALSRARVHCIRFEEDGTVWLATDTGLGRLQGTDLDLIGTEQGLPNQMLYWILEDPSGYFWISSDLGVIRINRVLLEDLYRGLTASINVLVIGREDGMPSTECNSGSPGGTRRDDGTFCFATTNGVGCIDPIRVQALEEPPRVTIEEVVIDGRAVPPIKDSSPPAFEIPSGTRRVEIRYGAVSLTASEKLTYRYRMQAFDPDWIEVGQNRVAHFTGLPPGRLRFSVTARHGDGPWNDPPAALELDIQPAFHQTLLFSLLVGAGIVFATWAIYRLRTAQLRRRESRLRDLVAHRTAELEAANIELARLAIVDPLTDLANRRRFDEVLEAEWNRGFRNSKTLSMLMIDIDHFKEFNDHNGHLAGDECLRRVAGVLASVARRPGDLAARYGGEEFTLLLPETDRDASAAIAESARRNVEALGIPHPASSTAPVITISVGWAGQIPAEMTNPETLIATADEALYRAKKTRNCVVGPSIGDQEDGPVPNKAQ